MNEKREIPRLAMTVAEFARSTGIGRDMIFDAISAEKLTARKAGYRTTLIEFEEGQRWFRSLPWRGKAPDISG